MRNGKTVVTEQETLRSHAGAPGRMIAMHGRYGVDFGLVEGGTYFIGGAHERRGLKASQRIRAEGVT
jgi:hypothetical protein